MTKKTGAYIVMIAGLILLIINIYELDFSNLKNNPPHQIVNKDTLLFLASIYNIDIDELNNNPDYLIHKYEQLHSYPPHIPCRRLPLVIHKNHYLL